MKIVQVKLVPDAVQAPTLEATWRAVNEAENWVSAVAFERGVPRECGHIDTKNRASQSLFTCRNCGVVAHADRNASRNIARKGEAAWIAGRQSRVPAIP